MTEKVVVWAQASKRCETIRQTQRNDEVMKHSNYFLQP